MAEPRKLSDEVTVNDGSGLLDNIGLLDSLIVDCNDLPKLLMTGQCVLFCQRIVHMVQKLSNLKEGIRTDIDARDKQIADLRRLLDEVTENGGEEDVLEC